MTKCTNHNKLLFVLNEAYFFMSHRLAVAHALRDQGFEVHVAVPEDHVWAPDDFSLDEVRKEGFAVHVIPLSRRGINPWRELLSLIAIWKLYSEIKPKAVHLLTIKPVLYGGIVARLQRISGVICGITGLGQVFISDEPQMKILRPLIVRVYRFVTNNPRCRIIVQNSDDFLALEASGAVNAEKMVLIRGSGVSMEEFSARSEAKGIPLFILPSRLIWEKGVGEFVEAARILKSRGVQARFALVGDTKSSNPRSVPEKAIENWVKEGIIEWWGRRTDMSEVMAQSRAVVLPSFYGEGVPKVLIEAAAIQRAIITTDTPGCREIVKDEVNGLLVSARNVWELASAMSRLIEDIGLCHEMGQAGRKLVGREFSEEIVIEKTLKVYSGLYIMPKPSL
jgi:glycosyltransferase involved in cell wall biosynthesis